MRSNYKKIGPYIRQVDVRNVEDKKENLLGVSTQKVFIDSIANTVGTDFRTYKVVKRRQFTYVADTSRRGDRIGIALLETHDEGLVSPVYTVFEITDHEALLPEYLMMWFRRPEFDRYARFKSHGSVRELFDWEEMCDVELPMPTIEKQREIVKEYHTIVDRIKLNERLNQKLEEAAQAIYKQWFVDFEFPISAEYAAAIGKPELEGQPYKSSGGEMVFNEVLKQEIPKEWEDCLLSKKIEFKNGKTRPSTKGDIPVYGGNGILDYVGKHNYENIVAIGRVGAYCGSLHRVIDKCWISDNAICANSKDDRNGFSFYLLKTLSLNERGEGTGQPLITQDLLNSIKTFNADSQLEVTFDGIASKLDRMLTLIRTEIDQLRNFSSLLLSSLAQKQ